MGTAACSGEPGPRAGSSAMGSRLHRGEMGRCRGKRRVSAVEETGGDEAERDGDKEGLETEVNRNRRKRRGGGGGQKGERDYGSHQ